MKAKTQESRPAIELRDIEKTYGRGKGAVTALHKVNVTFEESSFTAVMGPSGSGKSTMIQCAAGLDKPSKGTVHLGEIELQKLKEPKLTITRREHIGFIFQAFNLLPSLTALQNIELPVKLAGGSVDRAWLDQIITAVGMVEQMKQRPAELSGGQQQRVAIARALASKPRVVFADEPTGALDTKSGKDILGLLRQAVDQMGQTVIMVTHDPLAASYADRVLFLADGRIVDELWRPSIEAIASMMTSLEA